MKPAALRTHRKLNKKGGAKQLTNSEINSRFPITLEQTMAEQQHDKKGRKSSRNDPSTQISPIVKNLQDELQAQVQQIVSVDMPKKIAVLTDLLKVCSWWLFVTDTTVYACMCTLSNILTKVAFAAAEPL